MQKPPEAKCHSSEFWAKLHGRVRECVKEAGTMGRLIDMVSGKPWDDADGVYHEARYHTGLVVTLDEVSEMCRLVGAFPGHDPARPA